MSNKQDVLIVIKEKIGMLTKTQRLVADCVVKNPMQAAFSTVEQLAHAAGTSTTTIVRLASTLGYTGYSDFQKHLQNGLQSNTSPFIKLENSFIHSGLQDGMVNKVVQQQMENYMQTVSKISEEMIFQTVDRISKAKSIYVVGYRSSVCVAQYISFNMDRIFGNCCLLGSDSGDPEKVARIGKGDVLIAISMPRYIRQVDTICRIAKESGAYIIVITDGFLSPLAESADTLFGCECKSLGFHNSLSSAMLIAELLIDVSTMKNSKQLKNQLLKTEKVLQAMNVHLTK